MYTTEVEKCTAVRTGQTMRSAVITEPGTISLRPVDVPAPGDGEVRVRIEGCGLCASSLPVWEGRDWFDYPEEAGSPGHEGWGVVDAVGRDVVDFSPGDRVTALSWNAFAEYDIAPESNLVALPDSLSGLPFPGEPLGCALNIFRRSGIEADMTVAVIGVGFLGSLLVQLAKDAGAEVIALSRRTSSLEMAERFGADAIFRLTSHKENIEQVEKRTGDEFCDCVIEATGTQEGLTLAGNLTGVRSRLVIAGYHQDGNRSVDMQLWNWRGIDVINAHEREPAIYVDGIRRAVEAVEEGRIDPLPLFTHTWPKEEIQQAFETHRQKPEGFTKALIIF